MNIVGWAVVFVVANLVVGGVVALAPQPISSVVGVLSAVVVFSLALDALFGVPLVGFDDGLLVALDGRIAVSELLFGAFVVLVAVGGIVEGS
jgi:hypothetical protein